MSERLHISKTHEHLIEGVKPIIVSIGTSFDHELRDSHYLQREEFKNATDVNYDKHHKQGFAVSEVDGSYKFSEGFYDCSGLVITGIDKETGQNISFLSHQATFVLDDQYKSNFLRQLRDALEKIKEKCVPGTIDGVIMGGTTSDNVYTTAQGAVVIENHLAAIKIISQEVLHFLGFQPILINGPKKFITRSPDKIYYDNKNRRLYFVRDQVNPGEGDTTYNDLVLDK